MNIYHVLTDTDSTCLKFIFVSSTDSDIPDKKFRDIIFEVIVASKIYDRFDSSNIYWEKFGARKENLRKCLGYFEIEHIENPCFVTVAVNPKEYYESFEDNSFDKKYKGIKKGLPGMDFENYANRILSVNDCDFFEKPERDVKEVSRLTVVDGEMQQKIAVKTKFSQFNDKRFYFSDGIISLPLSQPYLKELNEYKEQKGQKIEKYFWQEKNKLLAMENKAQLMNERLSVYRQILKSSIQFFPLSQKDNFRNKFLNIFKDTRGFI